MSTLANGGSSTLKGLALPLCNFVRHDHVLPSGCTRLHFCGLCLCLMMFLFIVVFLQLLQYITGSGNLASSAGLGSSMGESGISRTQLKERSVWDLYRTFKCNYDQTLLI